MSRELRLAREEDAPALLEIYRPYVASGDSALSDVSFEYEVPSLSQWQARMAGIQRAFPYLVAAEEGRLAGYAYGHSFIERAAYHGCAEVTIYLAQEARGRGLGRALYGALEELLRRMGIVNAYACITASNQASLGFHQARGYRVCGSFPCSGFKNGHYLDMLWLFKQLAPYPRQLPPLRSFPSLPQAEVAAVLARAGRS